MSAPDPKLSRRVRDREALAAFALEHAGEPCDRCERRPGVHVHHKVFRSQGGDDDPRNCEWLCLVCHGDAHGLNVIP